MKMIIVAISLASLMLMTDGSKRLLDIFDCFEPKNKYIQLRSDSEDEDTINTVDNLNSSKDQKNEKTLGRGVKQQQHQHHHHRKSKKDGSSSSSKNHRVTEEELMRIVESRIEHLKKYLPNRQ